MKTKEQEETKSRESGYYWVQVKTREWFIAEYESFRGTWTQVFSTNEFADSDFEQIDERKISRVDPVGGEPNQEELEKIVGEIMVTPYSQLRDRFIIKRK